MIVSPKYLVKRTIQSIFLICIAISVLYFGFRLMPGDFTDMLVFDGASQEDVEQIREDWGLNDPLYIQYMDYMTNLATGEAGISTRTREPVTSVALPAMFNSIILIAPAITLGYILGSIFGVVAGMNRGSKFERYGIIILFGFGATPIFFMAVMMIIIFATNSGLFPTSGYISPETRRTYVGASWWRIYLTQDFLLHYTLPFVTIVLRYIFFPSLIMRTSVVEIKDSAHMYYRRIAGIPYVKRLYYIGKHSSLPVITLYPVSLTQAIGGLVLLEIVFNWPGVGFLLIQSIFSRDFPVLMFVFSIIVIFIVAANFIVDLVYSMIDPRISLE